jgi:hypothetical protein
MLCQYRETFTLYVPTGGHWGCVTRRSCIGTLVLVIEADWVPFEYLYFCEADSIRIVLTSRVVEDVLPAVEHLLDPGLSTDPGLLTDPGLFRDPGLLFPTGMSLLLYQRYWNYLFSYLLFILTDQGKALYNTEVINDVMKPLLTVSEASADRRSDVLSWFEEIFCSISYGLDSCCRSLAFVCGKKTEGISLSFYDPHVWRTYR